jgi:hypothetical protein
MAYLSDLKKEKDDSMKAKLLASIAPGNDKHIVPIILGLAVLGMGFYYMFYKKEGEDDGSSSDDDSSSSGSDGGDNKASVTFGPSTTAGPLRSAIRASSDSGTVAPSSSSTSSSVSHSAAAPNSVIINPA